MKSLRVMEPVAVCVADHARAGLWLCHSRASLSRARLRRLACPRNRNYRRRKLRVLSSCAYTTCGPEGGYYGRSNRCYDLYDEFNGFFLCHGSLGY